MSLADYQIPIIQNLDSFRGQLNAILADIFSRLVSPSVSGAVNTTDATVTTVGTIPTTSNTTLLVDCNIVGRRTGGSSGSAGDGAGYLVRAVAKNVAGVVTIIGQATTVIGESQAAWDAVAAVSGTDIVLRVTGAANNNISWACSGQKRAI
jgi:hypothetical protein